MESVLREMKTVTDLVMHVLKRNPATRENDTLLYLECCECLGAKSISDIKRINLSIISVHKIRQRIQNKDGLFKAPEEVQKKRRKRSVQIKEYMIIN